ncbi:O-antigen ligase family protein [Candidatus Pelagibacter sp. HIMB1611]|uniref:O-antigen ligase family protein n=1 Tax=Candidatus Pelagibacter sp. HIMB1611 TaxID=3413357 RepID=UPI003F86FA47
MNKKVIKFENIVGVFFALLPVALISGPFFSDLIASIICIYAILNFKKSKIDLNNIFIKLAFIFYLCFILNSLLFEYRLESLKNSLPYIRFFFFAVGIKIILDADEKYFKYFLYACILSILLVCFFGFVEYFKYTFQYFQRYTELNSLETNDPSREKLQYLYSEFPNRISGIFQDEKIMGSYLFRLFPLFAISFFYFNQNLDKKKLLFFIFIVVIIYFNTFISGDRAPLILLSFLIFLIFLVCSNLRKIFTKIIIFILIISSFTLFFDSKIKERIIDQTLRNIQGAYNDGELTLITKEHQGHFNAAYIIFKEYPILGAATKGFRYQCYNNLIKKEDVICTNHPHTPYLQLLSETGILGTLIAIIIFFTLFFKIFIKENLKKNIRSTSLNIVYIALFVSFWPLTTSGSIFNNYNSIFYYIPLGLFLFLNKKNV